MRRDIVAAAAGGCSWQRQFFPMDGADAKDFHEVW
jgi:hypothetical protein